MSKFSQEAYETIIAILLKEVRAKRDSLKSGVVPEDDPVLLAIQEVDSVGFY